MRTLIVGWFERIIDISIEESILLENEDYFRELYMKMKGVLYFFSNEEHLRLFKSSSGQLVSREEKC